MASKLQAVYWLLVVATLSLAVGGALAWSRRRRLVAFLGVACLVMWVWYTWLAHAARARGLL